MFHHILFWDAEKVIRDQRYSIIVDEMQQRERRTTPFQADIQVDQVVLLGVGQCGQGDERRVVESSFEVKKGDQLFVYREGK
jgi:hypothetical protein